MKILTVGRIAPVKNYEVLIEAARILINTGVDFSITIVGEPALEYDQEYDQRIRRESAGLNIHFVGKKSQHELPEIYRSHDVFAHMSQTGSLDKVLLEAMACGMAVVSCNDAAKSFLPKECIFSANDPRDMASKIMKSKNADFDSRQYVLDNHDLKKLISRISTLL